jgi:hypothetical protein
MRRARLSLITVLLAAAVSGCGAHHMTPVDPRGAGALRPAVEDADGGMVGLERSVDLGRYKTVVLVPFTVEAREIKDDEDARLARDMAAYLHAQLLRRLEGAGVFTRVIDGAIVSPPADGLPSLRLEGVITRLTEGDRALRYFVGFGAGAAKAQIETRLIDAHGGTVAVVTADRRAAGMGIFGGDGRQFLTESMDQMAEGYAKLLRHLAAGGQPGKR